MWQRIYGFGKNPKMSSKRKTAEVVEILDFFGEVTDTRWVSKPDVIQFFADLGFHRALDAEGYPDNCDNLWLFKRNKKACCAIGIIGKQYEIHSKFLHNAFYAVSCTRDVEFVVSSALTACFPQGMVDGCVYMYYSTKNPPKGFNTLPLAKSTERSCY